MKAAFWSTFGMREAEIRELPYGAYVDHCDTIYEQHRDPDNPESEAETGYQQRRFKRLFPEGE